MIIFFSIIIFILGLTIGSFLNVVINRLKIKQNIVAPRSYCPKCKHKLGFFDLIPVFSFIFLQGKCHYCHKKISWQYPLVELATGISFLLLFLKLNSQIINTEYLIFNIVIFFFFASILIIIFVYDLKHYLIPNKIVYPALIITLVLQILLSISKYPNIRISNILIGSLIPGVFFLILVLISKEKWMGAGDVKLGFLCGLMLGYPNILVALFLSFVSGALVGLALIIFKKKGLKDKLPYGTFLTASTLISFLFANQIINWYLTFLGIM